MSSSVPELVPALDRPTATADRKVAAYRQARTQRGGLAALVKDAPKSYTFAPLDTAALSRQYGMEGASKPQWKVATFQAPLGLSETQLAKFSDDAKRKFIKSMDKQGWDLAGIPAEAVTPGVYPAVDLRDNVALLDRREMLIGMWFTFRNPKPVRIELPPHLLQEYTVKGL